VIEWASITLLQHNDLMKMSSDDQTVDAIIGTLEQGWTRLEPGMTRRQARRPFGRLMLSAVLVFMFASLPISLVSLGPANAAGILIASPPCMTSQLSLGFGAQVSPAMGEHAVVLTLTNKSGKYCQLLGYPSVSFYTATGRVLPFSYSRVSQYFPRIVPRLVGLRTGTRGYFEVAKYRCDLGDLMTPSIFKVSLAASAGVSLARRVPLSPRVGVLTYCKGGVKDPGQFVGVSPIVATQRQLAP
jgi:hypothetical protein